MRAIAEINQTYKLASIKLTTLHYIIKGVNKIKSKMSLKLTLLISLMSVFVALVSCDIVMDTLESSYNDANLVLSPSQQASLDQFKVEVENAGVDLTIDHEFVIPKYGCQKSISKTLVQKHGKYSPDSKNPNGLAQYRHDFSVFIEGPCDAIKKDVFKAVTAFYVGSALNPKYIELVKERPFLNDWLQKARLCTQLYGKTDKLVNSSYDYMVAQG